MKAFASIFLRSMLAIALMVASLPAWSMDQTPPSMQQPGGAAQSTGDQTQDCHKTQAESPSNDAPEERTRECCAEASDCGHQDCSCLVITSALPARGAYTSPTANATPVWALPAASPRDITSTLLRPPRA